MPSPHDPPTQDMDMSSRPVTTPDDRHPLVLNWILTEPPPGSGGHATAIRLMNLLASFGHHVNVYVVPYKRLVDKSDLEIRDYVRRHFASLEGYVFKWSGGPMAESDAVILTFWETAYLLGDTNNIARIFYLVQDWEPFFYPMSLQYLRAEQTYKMGFACITAGPWLPHHLRKLYGVEADYFDLAVDHGLYYPRPLPKPHPPRICFYARPSTPRRLVPLGLEALARVRQRRPDVQVVLYGATSAELAAIPIPFPHTQRGILTEDQLAELYSASDVGLVFSPTNCSRVPLEMMACRCAVVDLNRETVKGILEHEVNALLAEPTPEAVATTILRLLDDGSLRQRLVETAYQQVQSFSWEKSARQVEAILSGKLASSARHRPTLPARTLNLPMLSELSAEQQQFYNTLHQERRRFNRTWRAAIREWLKPLLQADQTLLFNQAPVKVAGEIRGQRSIGQSFVARRDQLCRIDVLAATFGRRNTRDLVFRLKTSPDAQAALAAVRINASQLVEGGYVSFVFPPQANSRGQAYYFCIESPESIAGDAISLWAFRHANLAEATLYQNGHRRPGMLIFGAFYRSDPWGEVGERPIPVDLRRATTHRERWRKAYRLLTTQGLAGLSREIKNYRRWKSIQRRNST